MPPFVFIENNRLTEAPTAEKKWLRKGAAGPSFEAIDVLPTLTRKAGEFAPVAGPAARPTSGSGLGGAVSNG